jgi:hypothetical protein
MINTEELKQLNLTDIVARETGQQPKTDGRHNVFICPFHSEKTGSFKVHMDKNFFYCFGCGAGDDGGDTITFIGMYKNLDFKDACEYLAENYGNGSLPELSENSKKPEKRKKPEPEKNIEFSFIIDSDIKQLITKTLKDDFYLNRYGTVSKVWKYRDTEDRIINIVARFDSGSGKQIVPFYLDSEKKWKSGQPIKTNRTPYNVNHLKKTEKVVYVEGEKCALAGMDYLKQKGINTAENTKLVFITSVGGSKQVKKTDFSCLKGKDLVIWPDNDEPGIDAAKVLKTLVSDYVNSVQVLKPAGNAKGYDIADHIEDGEDPLAYIRNAERILEDNSEEQSKTNKTGKSDNQQQRARKSGGDPENSSKHEKSSEPEDLVNPYFTFLGWDKDKHYFLPTGSEMVYEIRKGSLSTAKILEIAPLDFWVVYFPGKSGTMNANAAFDYVISESKRAGIFNPELLRGAGVWEDNGQFVLNTGKYILDRNNVKHTYSEYRKAKAHYLMSTAQFGKLPVVESTLTDGAKLMQICDNSGFKTILDQLAFLGWSLMASFGGMLEWRPHIWITGAASSGKSWLLGNLVKQMTGEFAVNVSGKTTEAGMRRLLLQDARPLIIDEAEPKNKDARVRLESILDLCRNASNDSSAQSVMANMSGGVDVFRIRSMFCFASVVPNFQGRALESRIIRIEIKNKDNNIAAELNGRLLTEIGDFSKFRTRIFKRLDRIKTDIDYAIKKITNLTGDRRKAQQYAPLLASVWNILTDVPLENMTKDNALYRCYDLLSEYKAGVRDEEEAFNHMLNALLDINGDRYLCSEHITYIEKQQKTAERGVLYKRPDQALQRHGLRIFYDKNLEHEGKTYKDVLYIKTNDRHLMKIFEDTAYIQYAEVLKRHVACISDKVFSVRIAKTTVTALAFDMQHIRKMYFEDSEGF